MAMSVEDTGNHAQAESGQIERLMQSRELRDCESLKLLLQFLAENSLSAPRGPAPSEQQIALEVLGGGFDRARMQRSGSRCEGCGRSWLRIMRTKAGTTRSSSSCPSAATD